MLGTGGVKWTMWESNPLLGLARAIYTHLHLSPVFYGFNANVVNSSSSVGLYNSFQLPVKITSSKCLPRMSSILLIYINTDLVG